MTSGSRAAGSGEARRPRPPDRNPHPWRVAALLAVGLFILTLLTSLSLASTALGPETLGAVYAAVLPGCLAVGIWAKKSQRRWNTAGWVLRIAVCLVLSGVVMGALALASQLGTAPQ
jgi:membrane protease YdiL (CAAX protease family)